MDFELDAFSHDAYLVIVWNVPSLSSSSQLEALMRLHSIPFDTVYDSEYFVHFSISTPENTCIKLNLPQQAFVHPQFRIELYWFTASNLNSVRQFICTPLCNVKSIKIRKTSGNAKKRFKCVLKSQIQINWKKTDT